MYTDPDGLLFRVRRADGSEEIITDEQFNAIKNNPHNRELGVVVKGGKIYNTDDDGNLFVVATYERIWFDDLTAQANYAIWGVAARAPAMQKLILGFAAANLLPAAGIVGSMTAAGGGLTTLGLGTTTATAAPSVVGTAFSQATLRAFQRQLAQHGRAALEKSLTSFEKRLAEHLVKIEAARRAGGYKFNGKGSQNLS